MVITRMISVAAQLDETTVEGATRYRFDLYGKTGESGRTFIIDIPDEDSGKCEVWVSDSTVSVGDTGDEDFVAIFTPIAPVVPS